MNSELHFSNDLKCLVELTSFCVSCVLLDLMETVMLLDTMKAITTPVLEVEEMPRATLQSLHLTGGNPEVEDDPHLSEEFL